MIHSMAGGELKINNKFDFAKIEIIEGYECGTSYWFISPFSNIKVGDLVIVPLGKDNKEFKGKVLRIDKNISEQTAPFPIKRMKKIISIINF